MSEFQVAGGGDFPQQQTIVVQPAPTPDPGLTFEWWMTAVAVPIIVAMIPVWIMRKRIRFGRRK